MYFKNHKGFIYIYIYIAIAFPESIQYQNITQWYLNLFNYKKTSWIINWFTDFKKAHRYLTWKKIPFTQLKQTDENITDWLWWPQFTNWWTAISMPT